MRPAQSDTDMADCWYSADLGVTWVPHPAPWPATHADGIEATDDLGIAMASGYGMSQSSFRLRRVG
jgi:hypothetical protein